jgi:hypothetical protein
MKLITIIFHLKHKGDSKDHNIRLIKEELILIFFKFKRSLRSKNTKGQQIIVIKSLFQLSEDFFTLSFRQSKNKNFKQNMENSSHVELSSLS